MQLNVDNATISETISSELADTFPNATLVIFHSQPRTTVLKQGAMLASVLIVGQVVNIWASVLLLMAAMMKALWYVFISLSVRPFTRKSVKGSLIREKNGIITRSGSGSDIVEFSLYGCRWHEISDLRVVFQNRAFPNQGCIAIAPSSNAFFDQVRFVVRDSFIVCGFTDETRTIWRHRLKECGAIETPTSNKEHAKAD